MQTSRLHRQVLDQAGEPSVQRGDEAALFVAWKRSGTRACLFPQWFNTQIILYHPINAVSYAHFDR